MPVEYQYRSRVFGVEFSVFKRTKSSCTQLDFGKSELWSWGLHSMDVLLVACDGFIVESRFQFIFLPIFIANALVFAVDSVFFNLKGDDRHLVEC